MADNESTHIGEIEARYRAQVIERYNRLGFAGLGVGDLRLSDVALNDVFVRLTLTVEETVLDPNPPKEQEREQKIRNPFRPSEKKSGERKEDDRPREQTIKIQKPISLGDALAQHALIVGEPGAGKSTLLRWLAVTFAANRQREVERLGPQAEADRLPLLVELGKLPQRYLQAEGNEKPFWPDLIPEEVLRQGKLEHQKEWEDVPDFFLKQALAEGRCLILCDGLDEIADLNVRGRIQNSLTTYADIKYPNGKTNRLVLSSRPAGVSSREGVLTIQRFTPENVRRVFGFLCAQYKKSEKDADALYAAVQAKPKTLELATTPLLAALLFALWNKNQTLPERRVKLYERCCEHLIRFWGEQHKVGNSELLKKMRAESWERHLRVLAPVAYFIHSQEQRTDANFQELTPILAQALLEEGLLTEPASANADAEEYLRALGLSSGLLQRVSGDRYGFPHLTFQEYLTARHIAAQPDPDYIDTVMEHLHKAWWREVHLLVIGHLGSGSEGADKASKLLHIILHRYPLPWRMLRPAPSRDKNLVARAQRSLSVRIDWQLERRLAWALTREFVFASAGFSDCMPLGATADMRRALSENAQRLLLRIVLDPGRIEEGDTTHLAAATSSLVQLGQVSRQVVTVLVGALGDSSELVREAAARSLVQLGEASGDVVAVLVAALGNSDWSVRAAAASSLGKLGQASDDVVATLVAALGDSLYRVRQPAARSLVQLGQDSRDVVATLVGALDNPDWCVREAAASGLGNVGQVSEDIVAALVGALSDSEWPVRQEAASSLGRLGQVSEEVEVVLVAALGDSEWLVRQSAASSLGQLGQTSEEIEAALVSALSGSHWFMRLTAARSLGDLRLASEKVVAVLVGALGDSDDFLGRVKQAAAISLVELGQASPGVVSTLVDVSDDSDWRVRQAAVSGLGHLRQASEEVVAVLIRALGDSDWRVRQEAASSLVQLGEASGEAVAVLIGALGDSSRLMRQVAASSLVQLGQVLREKVVAFVNALGHFDTSFGSVRQVAASSLVQLDEVYGEVVEELLLAMIISESKSLVREAASSLGQLKIEDETQLRPVLIALNRRLHDRDDGVRRAALTAIRQLLDGRQIPGYRWVPIRERRERARKRRILGYWVLGIATAVLVAWVAAGLTTYLSLDEFWVRFVGALAALVALAAGGVQVLGYFRRPPWDRQP